MQVRYDARRRTTEAYRQPQTRLPKTTPTLAHVLALDPDPDSGVLLTPDEQIIRFHRSSVVDFDFERMAAGDRVRHAGTAIRSSLVEHRCARQTTHLHQPLDGGPAPSSSRPPAPDHPLQSERVA